MPYCRTQAPARRLDMEVKVLTMTYRVGTTKRVLAVSLAAGLAVAHLGGSSGADAAGIALTEVTVHHGIVPVQTSPAPDKKAESQKPKKNKRRALRCGGPGLPDCPM